MPDELDELYSRTRLLWEADPEAFEKDQPLLARAFRDQPADQTPALHSLNAELETLRAELRNGQLTHEMQQAVGMERERLLRREWEEERRLAHALVQELAEARKRLEWAERRPKITLEEASILAEIGVSKGLAPD